MVSKGYTELVSELKKIESSRTFDPKSLDRVIEFLEHNIPDAFADVFHLDDKERNTNFEEAVKKRLLSRGGDVRDSEKDLRLCYQFFQLLALLGVGADVVESSPPFWNKVESLPPEVVVEPRLHLRRESSKIDNVIEIALYCLGHEHDPESGAGILNEERADKAYRVLSTQWAEVPEFIDWLIPYLSFRLIRILANIDLFYAMHSPLPHYREFKVLAYMLWLLGREQYAAIGQFAQLSHRLYYAILLTCGKVFSTEASVLELQKAVSGTLEITERELKNVIGLTKTSPRNDLQSLTLRVTARFFTSYINELSEVGRFHIVLWSLPMFKEVKEALQSVAQFGKRGLSILIIGETGTGKESIAKLFLKTSGEPYVPVNCAGLTWKTLYEDLFETGGDSTPLVEQVSAVLLDELDKAQLDAQGGILRFLDKPYGECRRLGHLTTVRWDGLTVATATDRVYEAMKSGLFLPDLFWRFDIRAHITPLREAMAQGDPFDSLFALATRSSRAKFGVAASIEVTQDQLERLRGYEWPGNLREMLEFADSLIIATIRESRDDAERHGHTIKVPERVFQKVFSQFEYFGKKLLR